MNHYEELFKRKSVRNYEDRPLAKEHMDRLNSWRTWVVPYCDFAEIPNHIRILTSANTKGSFKVKAPAYIVYTSMETPLSRINAGFILMQIALELSSMGVGCCFQGSAKPDEKQLVGLRYPYVITLACGYNDAGIHREPSAFKRKPVDKLFEGISVKNLTEAIRLAPSALNRQPWRFIAEGDKLHVYAQNAPTILKKMLDSVAEIDMGIVLYYVKLAAEHGGQRIRFDSTPKGRALETKGKRYITTVHLSAR